jgi:lipid II:glycine glycyltransferase (peptidoglycan interpeptide bridge formation enzyme)
MQPISSGYLVEVDRVNESTWYEILSKFGDANIYQTWAYGTARFGANNISHLVLKRDRQIVAAVQLRIIRISPVNVGIAYVRWGPLWRRRDLEYTVEDFRQMIIALKREYVDRRGFFLRLIPNETELCQDELRPILENVGFKWHQSDYRTLYLNLRTPLEEIRSNMSKNWRKHLNKAERRGMMVVEGANDCLFENVYKLYGELLSRKRFEPGIKIEEYRKLQNILPDSFKMHIMVCEYEKRPIAGLVGSSIGDVGIELIAATGDDGLEFGGSYLLRWKMLEYLKNSGCQFYNLNGVNPERNPGGYQFKSGLCAKNGLDVKFLGTFEAYKSPLDYLAVGMGETLRKSYHKANRFIKNIVQLRV